MHSFQDETNRFVENSLCTVERIGVQIEFKLGEIGVRDGAIGSVYYALEEDRTRGGGSTPGRSVVSSLATSWLSLVAIVR